MGRRAKGEGTIYPRKDGRYEGAAYLPTATGGTKRVRVYGRTQAEVRERLTEAKANAQQGIPVPGKVWRVGDYLDYWLENVVRPSLRPKSIQQYESVSRLYLKPGLGSIKLTDLSVPMVQAFLNEQVTVTVAKGHSISKVKGMRAVLRTALTQAQRDQLVLRNAAKLTKLPTSRRQRIKPWTADEAISFLSAAREEALFPAYALLLLYGFRRGEALGLRWQDVDFQDGVIRVQQQLQKVGKELVIGPVKTENGERDLPLLTVARALLSNHRNGKRASVSSAADALVFTMPDGEPVDPDHFYRAFKRICRTLGVRYIKVHHVRHTTGTILKRLGVPDRDIQLILGHSHVSVTQEIYQHTDLEDRRLALSKIETALFTPEDNKSSDFSRQFSRQKSPLYTRRAPGRSSNRLQTWCWGRDSNPRRLSRLIYSSTDNTLEDRLTSVNLELEACRRQWFLGVVAVKLAVKPDTRLFSCERGAA